VKQLREGYTRGVFLLEVSSILGFTAVVCVILYRVAANASGHGLLLAGAAFTGFLAADFTSGFVHWMADTWGSPDMPLIGRALVRPFREHHIDPLEITRHGFIETNGNNCLISIPSGLIAIALPVGPGHALGLYLSASLGSLILWVMGTNQFHKWAHLPEPRGLVAFLQRCRLILPPKHHAIHHKAPFAKYYCITVGWLNWPLTQMRFFRVMEAIVSAFTGMKPRADDLGLPKTEEAAAPVPSTRGV
jgi:ubiquitin-conjugating enzyme E2 variant